MGDRRRSTGGRRCDSLVGADAVLDTSFILQAEMEDQQCGMRAVPPEDPLIITGLSCVGTTRSCSLKDTIATSNDSCAWALPCPLLLKVATLGVSLPLCPSAPQEPAVPANYSAFSLTPRILQRSLLQCVPWSLSCPLALPLATADPVTSSLTLNSVTFHASPGAYGKLSHLIIPHRRTGGLETPSSGPSSASVLCTHKPGGVPPSPVSLT